MAKKHIETEKASRLKSKHFIMGLVIVALISGIAIILLGGYLKDKVETGNTISVDYIGSLDDGKVFDTSIKSEAVKAGLPLRDSYSPLSFVAGVGQMIKGFDEAVIGMQTGEEKTIKIPPEKGYGEYNPNAIIVVTTDEFKKLVGKAAQIGYQVQARNGAIGNVTKINNNQVTIDFNHELAGKTLTFYIKIIKIDKTTKN